jgi:Leucine-rich repeat (LRR) protein
MPYVILDLHAASVSDSSVTLVWTATGDDADQGTAATYDIRYSKSSITPDNWDNATQVVGEPSPQVAGSSETFEVRGLEEDSTYYFALETCDEANNCPNISTCGPATCFDNFPVSFPDSALDQAIRAQIGKDTGQLYRSDLMTLAVVDANERNISSLSGLEYCPELTVVFLSHNAISDLTPFANLHKLYSVQLNVNNITNISALAYNANMAILLLRDNSVSDLSALAFNYRIHLLDLRNNNVSDLNILASNLAFAGTDTLYITGNPLSQTATGTQIPTLRARGVTVIN